jgi:hypothetical protein
MASGLNSSARQVGQSLGVAVAGSPVAARLHGTMSSGFLAATRPAWILMAACGAAVTGLAVTARQARKRAGDPASTPG